jgi:hypothetical protein
MYGENGGRLRAELTTLLRQHRIQQRLGGKGLHTVPETTTVEERQALGELIGRYRQTVLVWCLQAVSATSPHINLEGTTSRSRGPVEELRYRLGAAIDTSPAGLPTLEHLTTPRDFQIVDTWRLAARAAALGEHDFGAGVGYGRLSEDQCETVRKDAAEIARALVGLDRRYANIPGWQPLKDRGRLGRAAEICAAYAANDAPDLSVDVRGWRPPPQLDTHPVPAGINGILQSERNLLFELSRFPDAQSLRLILDSQRIVSRHLSSLVRTGSPPATRWVKRRETYEMLLAETRDLRGLLGNGTAAGQAAIVAARAQRLTVHSETSAEALQQTDRLFHRIDTRLTQVIEYGTSERLYFLRVKIPRLVDHSEGLVRQIRVRYVPVDSPVQTDLLEVVRSRLRRPPEQPRAPQGAGRSRSDFEAAITHRPCPRGLTPDDPSI